ncbi:hypothetical protein [Aneurinibacillus aneurinilyticus]|jgi:hypothetical protein|uniref:hypothetical protein n=1 Tax=Aneurinibacillus aneurinilyticus TaxID=1391 RepID=UPI0023F0F213|nr:hypothetical protein [Aneurinibacillus aneurinilyticus]
MMKKKLIGALMIAVMAFSGAVSVSAENIGNLNGMDLSNMDMDTALKFVQSQREQLSGSQLQNQINSAQQMDTYRIQSLPSKRNKAFDAMVNFIKRMEDSRNSIIGNMR